MAIESRATVSMAIESRAMVSIAIECRAIVSIASESRAIVSIAQGTIGDNRSTLITHQRWEKSFYITKTGY